MNFKQILSVIFKYIRNPLTVYKKEMYNYFYSPIAYVFLLISILIPNIVFFYFGGIFKENNASMRLYFYMLPVVYIIFIPGLTMGSWSKEKNDGTLELLFTLPFKSYEILLGKFFSSLSIVAIALISTLPLPILTHIFLGSFDIGQLICQYMGALLLASCFISICFFFSSITKEMIVSFLLSAAVLAFFTFIGYLTFNLYLDSFEWLNVSFEILKSVLTEISLSTHFINFSKGIIDSVDLFYYVGVTALFIFLNLRILESKRWS